MRISLNQSNINHSSRCRSRLPLGVPRSLLREQSIKLLSRVNSKVLRLIVDWRNKASSAWIKGVVRKTRGECFLTSIGVAIVSHLAFLSGRPHGWLGLPHQPIAFRWETHA